MPSTTAPSILCNFPARFVAAAIALACVTLFSARQTQWRRDLPPLAKELVPPPNRLDPHRLSISLHSKPEGGNYRAVKKSFEEKHLLDRTVELVKKARSLGVLVVHVTEGYTSDYREVDATNPGFFHRGSNSAPGLGRSASRRCLTFRRCCRPKAIKIFSWRSGIKSAYSAALVLNEDARAKGIKNLAIGEHHH